VDVEAIIGELERIRQNWIAVEREEYAEGLACMEVPIGRPAKSCRELPPPKTQKHHNMMRAFLFDTSVVSL